MNKNILKQIFILTVTIGLVLPQGVFAQDSGWGETMIDSGWGNTTIDSGWGNTTVDSGWGNTTIDSGWGTSVIDNSNTGWGNTTIDSGWGNTTVDSGWGNTTIDSGNTGWGNTTVVNQTSPTVYTQVSSPAVYGSINYGTPATYGYTNYGYTNYGSTNYGYVNYPSVSTVNTNVQCPSGSSLINGICTINTTTCPAGSSYINGVCTVNTINCPVGSYLLNGVCTSNTVVNNYSYTGYNTYQTCWDGSVIPSNSLCATQYKTCSNGSVVLMSQTCYRTCPNGSTIPDYQTCPYSYNTNVYTGTVTYPTVVKFNNVVTSPATQVTNNSARCNGIGLIANGVASTGWFEYGETANLGRDTTHTSIGTSVTSPFSNVLTNLKANTKYYCRAVMNNQYGTVKGSIVSFITKGTVVNYVAPKPAVKPVTTKKVAVKQTKVVKNEVVCTNWETVSVSSESQSALINAGQKLITVQLDKVSGNLYPGSEVNYKLDFKNVSSGRLNDVLVKVVLPEEFTFVSANVGSYDEETRTITFVQSIMDAYSEGIISFKVKVNNDALLGKSVVTTGYVSYTILSSGKAPVADEVTTYSVASITPNLTVSNLDTGAKKVIGATSSSTKTFLPNSLIEWLALVSIMFILFILGRSIYATYQDEEEKSH